MKKFFLLVLFLVPALSWAAGTVTVTKTAKAYGVAGKMGQVIQIDWVADAAAATVPNTSITLSGYVEKVITNPGSTAPTANYDIALGDPEDTTLDALAAALANRHTTTTEQVYPLIAGSPGTVTASKIFLPSGTYQFQLSNNAVNSATGRVLIYLTDQP